MAALAHKATLTGLTSRTLRSARPCLPARPAVRPCVAVRAAKSGEAFDSEQLKKNFDNLTADLQKKWEKNDEKPATVAIGVAGLLALITVSSVVDTIDRIPIVSNIIELIGICVSGWFTYRYLVFGPDREELFNNIKSFVNKIYSK